MARIVNAARLFGAALLAVGVSAGCDWPWRHDMADQPSASAAAGPQSPGSGSIPMEARGPFDRTAGELVANPLPPAPHDPIDLSDQCAQRRHVVAQPAPKQAGVTGESDISPW